MDKEFLFNSLTIASIIGLIWSFISIDELKNRIKELEDQLKKK